jgi:hypothetical protein
MCLADDSRIRIQNWRKVNSQRAPDGSPVFATVAKQKPREREMGSAGNGRNGVRTRRNGVRTRNSGKGVRNGVRTRNSGKGVRKGAAVGFGPQTMTPGNAPPSGGDLVPGGSPANERIRRWHSDVGHGAINVVAAEGGEVQRDRRVLEGDHPAGGQPRAPASIASEVGLRDTRIYQRPQCIYGCSNRRPS